MIKKGTHGTFGGPVEPNQLSPDLNLMIMNMIYFSGEWLTKFNKKNTKKRPFYIGKNKSVRVPMMKQTGKYRMKELETLNAKILSLPFKDETVRMFIILPHTKDGLEELEENLIKLSISESFEMLDMKNVSLENIKISIPKFEMELEFDMKQILDKMGFKKILREGFSRILKEEKVNMDKISQKYYIKVNNYECSLPRPCMIVKSCSEAGQILDFYRHLSRYI